MLLCYFLLLTDKRVFYEAFLHTPSSTYRHTQKHLINNTLLLFFFFHVVSLWSLSFVVAPCCLSEISTFCTFQLMWISYNINSSFSKKKEMIYTWDITSDWISAVSFLLHITSPRIFKMIGYLCSYFYMS